MKEVFYGGQERVLMKLVVERRRPTWSRLPHRRPGAAPEMIQMAAVAVKMEDLFQKAMRGGLFPHRRPPAGRELAETGVHAVEPAGPTYDRDRLTQSILPGNEAGDAPSRRTPWLSGVSGVRR